MGRWMAIGTVPGWEDVVKFGAELKETSKWRPDPQTTITSVYALGDGRMIAECHAVRQEDFEAWLEQKGFRVQSLAPIKHVARAGDIWKL